MSSQEHIDRIAIVLAEKAGLVWERLDKHPGFLRNRLRQEARFMLRGLADGSPSAA
ncbi:MAG TPA: hypothetical protein VGD19_04905 [Allosphingosinicella sp.]|jgi:hypothetical protein